MGMAKKYRFAALLLVIAMLVTGNVMPTAKVAQAQGDEVTTVWASDDSPTGYYVTFRYTDAEAQRVRIYGEWMFSDLEHATVGTSLNATPEEWQDGYTIWGTGNWPTADMTKDEETGIWSYTIPLPNGTWNYRFYVGGSLDADVADYTDAVMASDPSNPPMLYNSEEENLAGEEYLSSIYVPWDAEKQANTVRVEEEAPRDSENGEAFFSEVMAADDVLATFGIYLPYGFDAAREEPYPVLVMMHGGGGVESSWFNNGLVNILDNVIAEGRLEPTVVVTPNGSDAGFGNVDSIVNYILPYMVENYNVSVDPNRRAIAGLSAGSTTTMHAFFHYTDEFQYYMPMSAVLVNSIGLDYTVEGLADKTLWFGYGLYDFVKLAGVFRPAEEEGAEMEALWGGNALRAGNIYQYFVDLGNAGIPFTQLELPYGHVWALWRQCAVYMFDNVLWQ